MRSKDARAASTAVTPCSPTSLPASTASIARRVWAWTSLDQRADGGGGAAGLLGELAHLVGDDREAAPVLAGAGRLDGGVEGQEVGLLGDPGDGVDDRADLLGLGAELADGLGGVAGGRAQAAHRLRRRRHGGRALAGERAGLLGAALRGGDLVGRGARGAGHLLGQRRVRSTVSTCSRAPLDMPSIAVAISSTARPASSEVCAICWEATPRRVAEPDSRPTSERSWAAIVAKAVPKTSRSERGVGCTVRSPRAMRPAASAASRR